MLKLTKNTENPGVFEGRVRKDRVIRSTGKNPIIILNWGDKLERTDGSISVRCDLLDGALLKAIGAPPPGKKGRRLGATWLAVDGHQLTGY